MDAITKFVSKLISPPGDARWRQLEHVVALYVAYRAVRFLATTDKQQMIRDIVGTVMAVGKVVPGLAGVINEQQEQAVRELEDDLLGEGDPTALTQLPREGHQDDAQGLFETIKAMHDADPGTSKANAWGGIYHADDRLTGLQSKVWSMYARTNVIYPQVFPSVRKMEAEAVSMVVHWLTEGAQDDAADAGTIQETKPCGILTSGGTESILLAIKSMRDWAYETRGVPAARGELIYCSTAHGAFDKACQYFEVDRVKVKPSPVDWRLSAADVAARITPRTIGVVCSAPTYPHGVIDPVAEVAALCKARGIPLHVDNCLGGILLSSMKRVGVDVPDFDFRVPGVTSISCDLHKYGNAPKGASVVAFRSPRLRRHAIMSVADWAGGFYATTGMQGSRSGANVATTWATLRFFGESGYDETGRQIWEDIMVPIMEAVEDIPGLKLVTRPNACVVPIRGDGINIYMWADAMKKAGWGMQGLLTDPPAVHVCIGLQHKPLVSKFADDARAAAAALIAAGGGEAKGGMAGMYGTAVMLPTGDVEGILKGYIEATLKVKPAPAVAAAAGGGSAAAGDEE